MIQPDLKVLWLLKSLPIVQLLLESLFDLIWNRIVVIWDLLIGMLVFNTLWVKDSLVENNGDLGPRILVIPTSWLVIVSGILRLTTQTVEYVPVI